MFSFVLVLIKNFYDNWTLNINKKQLVADSIVFSKHAFKIVQWLKFITPNLFAP